MNINSVNDRASFDGIRRLINLVEIYTNIGTRVLLKYYGFVCYFRLFGGLNHMLNNIFHTL